MILKRLGNDGVPELKLNQLQLQMKRQVEEKILAQKYIFEITHCPICGVSEAEKLGEKDSYGFYYPTNVCKSCGMIFTNPRMTQLSYNEFYNDEYRNLYVGSDTAVGEFFSQQEKRAKELYRWLLAQNLIGETPLFVLEVGCGAGGILNFFKKKGHTVKGVDLGEAYLNYGRDVWNLDLESGTLKDLSLDKKPDLIIYSHVLEHILDLESELNLMKKHSHEDTIVYIEVPGVKNIHTNYWMNILRYFQNAHTYHFTRSSLTNLMRKYGYQLLVGNEKVMAAFKLKESYAHTPIINDYSAVMKYILRVEKLRKLYPLTWHGVRVYTKRYLVQALDMIGMRYPGK